MRIFIEITKYENFTHWRQWIRWKTAITRTASTKPRSYLLRS